jgi:hypothetical protein
MNDTQTLTLTDFLLARIAEDEAVAQNAWPDRWEQDGDRNSVQTAETGLRGGYEGLHMGVANMAMTVGSYRAEARNAAHIARHDPARVLAECEAKRRIVELHRIGDPDEWDPDLWACRLCQWDEDCDSPKHDYQHGAGRFPCDTLRHLAAVYADHPDYRDDWRP